MTETRSRRAPRPAARRRPGAAIRRLPLGSLRVFVAVAEHLSFTRAADALGVTTSAASMQVQALEDYLRVALFRRQGRQVELTAEGSALLPRVRQGLADLERALDEARADRGAGPLRVTTLASFLGQWLMPRLATFSELHPRIDLQVHTSPQNVDFARTGIDAGIRMGAGNWPHLHAEKLFDEWLVPVCRPALLKKHGPVETAEDLKRYRLMHSTSEPWSAWLFDDDGQERWPSSGIAFDDSVAIIRATEAGQGLALARWSLVADEVQGGRLAIASRRALHFYRSYWFVCPPAQLRLEKVDAFRRWLLDVSRDFPPPPGAAPAAHPPKG
ncbi:MAG TPA: transcriptional regulator GcvA [Steroidobacteraceae bacterium]|nr:transcriptional regulator GcvA [Steroidobacteraceae bacterium]